MLIDNTFEKCYRIGDLARLWGSGRETVRKLVKDDPGVTGLYYIARRDRYFPVSKKTLWCWRRGSFLVRENASRKLQIPQCRACHFRQGCQDSLHYLALRFCFLRGRCYVTA